MAKLPVTPIAPPKPQPGIVEVITLLGLFPLFFGIMCLLASMLDKNASDGAGMMLALVVFPLWTLTIIPSVIAAVIGLRSAGRMHPVARTFRQICCYGVLVLNGLAILYVLSRLLLNQ